MRKTSRYFVVLWALVFIFPHLWGASETPTLEGHWEGSIDIPGMTLEVDIDFRAKEDGSWEGDISIPAQKAKDLPLTNISLAEGEVSFVISGVPGDPTFKGTLSADGTKITGDFTQNKQTFPFSLSRETSPVIKAKEAIADFEDIVENGLKSLNNPGVAVAIVKDDEVIFAKGFGYRDVEKKEPMTADTLLAIGSASKAFTTFTMGTLVDEGKLDWNTPVREYIPWFRLYDPFASERLTPRDLVTHRSGLPRHDAMWYNNYTASREEFVRRLAYLKPTADLRERFQYNNLMFLTAGYLIEVLTEKIWEDAVRARVLDPLEMKRTNFSVMDSQKDANHALPYREYKDKIEKIPFRDITNIGPAGSINSSVNEMSHWLLVHLNQGKFKGEQVINPQTVQDMHLAYMPTGGTPSIAEITPADYGLGWFVDTYRGHRRVRHGGNIDGFSALVCMLPDDDVGIVALTNKSGSPLPELLIRHTSDLLLGTETKDWIGQTVERIANSKEMRKEAEEKKATRRKTGTVHVHKLKEYAGDYSHPGYGDLKVFLEESQLAFTYNGITTPLEHWHYETFNAKRAEDPTFEDTKITFRTDVNGYVAVLEVPIEPTLEDAVFKKKPHGKYFNAAYLAKFVGKYTLVNDTFTVSLKGDRLTLILPGQPEYDLVPVLGDEFILKQVKIISVKFLIDEKDNVIAAEFIQPNGVFEAKRVTE
jgi:CubicO group peptidase (beta-lactamase class C family)